MNEGMHLTLEAEEAITTKKNGMMRTVIDGEEMVGQEIKQASPNSTHKDLTVSHPAVISAPSIKNFLPDRQ